MRNGGDAVEVATHLGVAVDMRLGNLPIVDAGIARLAGVGEHDAGGQVARIDGHGFAGDSRRSQFDRTHPTVHGWVIILGAGGHLNDLRFDVLRDFSQFLEVISRTR